MARHEQKRNTETERRTTEQDARCYFRLSTTHPPQPPQPLGFVAGQHPSSALSQRSDGGDDLPHGLLHQIVRRWHQTSFASCSLQLLLCSAPLFSSLSRARPTADRQPQIAISTIIPNSIIPQPNCPPPAKGLSARPQGYEESPSLHFAAHLAADCFVPVCPC